MSEKKEDPPQGHEHGHGHDHESSRFFRAKKFLASATAGTKAGRKVIMSVVGEEGTAIIHVFKECVKKYSNADLASSFKKDLVKMMTKLSVLFDEKLINKEHLKDLKKPMEKFGTTLFRCVEKNAATDEDLAELKEVLIPLSEGVKVIFKPHVKPKNFDKIVNLLNYLNEPNFLKTTLNDKNYQPERQQLAENLSLLIQPQLHSDKAKEARPCRKQGCKSPSLLPRDSFKGSDFCLEHHTQEMSELVMQPKLQDFIDVASPQTTYFVQYLRARDDEEQKELKSMIPINEYSSGFFFLDATIKYKQLSRNLMKSRADVIHRRYFRPANPNADSVDSNSPLHVNFALAFQVRELITACDNGSPQLLNVFEEPVKIVRARLEQEFERFKTSGAFQAFVASVNPPPA